MSEIPYKTASVFNRNFVELALEKTGLLTAVFPDYPGVERQAAIELLLPSKE